MGDVQQAKGRSVAAIVALVLGIVAIVMSWMPIINNLAFVIGIIGLIVAIVGVVGVLRGKKAGKVLAIVALVVNIAALAIVLGTQSMYSAAIDDAVNGPSATSTSQQSDAAGDADDANDAANSAADAKSFTDLKVGTSVDLENGLSVSVDDVQTGLKNYDGSEVMGVQVTYTNNGDKSADYNPYDWKGEDAKGAQEDMVYYSEADNALNSGTLAAGGSVSGTVYFAGDTVKALYFASMVADEPTASWTLA